MKQWSKLPSLIRVNLKNMASNRMVIISLIICMGLLAFVCSGLIDEYEEKSSIPVGIVDKDNSTLSKEVLKNLSGLEGIVLKEGTIKEQEKELKDEHIYAYFVLEKGFEESVKKCEFDKLVHMVYLGQNHFVSMLSDVFTQAMIKEIVLREGERQYATFPDYENLLYTTDYQEFMTEAFSNTSDSFAFRYQFFNATDAGARKSNAVRNNMISAEMFISLGGIFLAFFILQVIACNTRSNGVSRRVHLSLIPWWMIEVADIVTLLLTEGVMAIVVLSYFVWKLAIPLSGHLFGIMALTFAFLLCITLLFSVLRLVLKSKVAYQFAGFITVLLLGGVSILTILGQLHVEWLFELVKKIPNYWFIGGITDIILGGKTIGIFDVLSCIVPLMVLYSGFTYAKYRNLEK